MCDQTAGFGGCEAAPRVISQKDKNKKELEMAARRETRSEHDAFLSRLAGRSLEERQRLSADHRAYLDGTWDVDADFGPAEQHQGLRRRPLP
ncbi:hypothetical protein PF006_g28797 [Phytophthora fragariae]|uniref:Uncharacterized protein n=1 Tax=Phytophthora fragariae TaxID=53985 RepID=A0A6A3QC88_9STRA|nr:hypothetical protein PF006_g28797 [Phytophthora fragariae]